MSRNYVTLNDVAKVSGLSRAQVSRALRGDPGVHHETRELAQKVAAEIGYTPNLAARSLASSKSTNVGLLIGEPLNPFHMLLAREIDVALAERNYDAVVSLRALDERSALSEAERLMSLRVLGLILIATPQKDAIVSEISARIPCVYVGKALPDSKASTVSTDDRMAVARVTEHLLSLGHRRIANIDGGEAPGAAERRQGYREAMAQVGLPPMEASGNPGLDAGKHGVEALMNAAQKPTAIITHNDIVAIGAINRLKELGLRVPEDVSVVGFDDIPYAASETLSLTTLRQDPRAQAEAVALELCRRVNDRSATPRSTILPASLQIRRSVAPPSRSRD